MRSHARRETGCVHRGLVIGSYRGPRTPQRALIRRTPEPGSEDCALETDLQNRPPIKTENLREFWELRREGQLTELEASMTYGPHSGSTRA